jgi:hypothetical protein
MTETIDLTKELGLTDVSEELRAEILLNAERSIYKRVLITVLETLNDAQKDELIKLLDAQEESENTMQSDAVIAFLRTTISDFDEMVQNEIKVFKDESTKLFAKIQAA